MNSDEKIKKDVIDNLYWDTRVNAADIEVDVKNGRVKLTGTVPSYTARNAATTNIWSIQGVESVENELVVRYPEEEEPPTDDDIQGNIEESLVWDSELDADEINVTVENNKVYLEGAVDSYWKRYKAEELANVVGVYSISNNIVVVPTQNFDDENIAKAVENAIIRNVNVDENDVEVEVENGIVTLRGEAKTWLEYKSASEAAYFSAGVKEVDNLMQITYLEG